jgi:hypothetical protein
MHQGLNLVVSKLLLVLLALLWAVLHATLKTRRP